MKHYNRFYRELGSLLQENRKKAKISQTEMAKRVGVNRISLSRWESGHIRPKNESIDRYCAVLGISSKDIIDLTNERVAQARENDVYNAQINDVIRVPLYDHIPKSHTFSHQGLDKFISISSYMLDASRKYFAYSENKDGDVLIFEHSGDAKEGDTVIAFIKDNGVVMPFKIAQEAEFEVIGVLRRAVKSCL